MVIVVFGIVVVIIIGGGVLIARLATVAKSKGSWVWGVLILIVLICIPLFILGICVWLLSYYNIDFSPLRR
ncbi:hypothetical protein C6497_03390 [Candidatus Poribacteria bacterium]|nr:MAG: hypothetical protein C6497_03390 [Candidatus Poribacteria bacterium]